MEADEGNLITLSEKAIPEVINFMIAHVRGLVCTTIKKR